MYLGGILSKQLEVIKLKEGVIQERSSHLSFPIGEDTKTNKGNLGLYIKVIRVIKGLFNFVKLSVIPEKLKISC